MDAVEAGKASPESVSRYRRALDELEAEAGRQLGVGRPVESVEPQLMEFEVTGDFGVRIVVKGPVSDARALEEAVARLVRDIRTAREDDAAEGDE